MDNYSSSIISSDEDLIGVYRTIALFLERQNFLETSTYFRAECEKKGLDINFSNKMKTDVKPSIESCTLESSFYVISNDGDPLEFIQNSSRNTSKPSTGAEGDMSQDSEKSTTVIFANLPFLNNLNPLFDVRDYADLREKFRNLQKEYEKLMALQINLMGQSKNISAILDSCKEVYPELFAQKENSTSKSVDCKQQRVFSEKHLYADITSPKKADPEATESAFSKIFGKRKASSVSKSKKKENSKTSGTKYPSDAGPKQTLQGDGCFIESLAPTDIQQKDITEENLQAEKKLCRGDDGIRVTPIHNQTALVYFAMQDDDSNIKENKDGEKVEELFEITMKREEETQTESFTNSTATETRNESVGQTTMQEEIVPMGEDFKKVERKEVESKEVETSTDKIRICEKVSEGIITSSTTLKDKLSDETFEGNKENILRNLDNQSEETDSLSYQMQTILTKESKNTLGDEKESTKENSESQPENITSTNLCDEPKSELPYVQCMDMKKDGLSNLQIYDDHEKIEKAILDQLSNDPMYKDAKMHYCPKYYFSLPTSPKKYFPNSVYFELNYALLKDDLTSASVCIKLLLLQALRWRITKSSSVERDCIVASYIANDILNLYSGKYNILEIFLRDISPIELKEAVARFINTLASLRQGRDYLCQSDGVLKKFLMPKVLNNSENSEESPELKDMLLVTLQKLSIRKAPRSLMVAEGLLEYLLILLDSNDTNMSSYCMEYCCALLMNLCLHRIARLRCSRSPSKVIHVLKKLLQNSDTSRLPYISGAIYSLLAEKAIKEEAQKQQIDVIIYHQIKKTSDKYLRKQLTFILQSRFNEDEDECNYDTEMEPHEEVDLLEPELDEDDPVVGAPQGEELLQNYKTEDDPKCIHMDSLCRPITPLRRLAPIPRRKKSNFLKKPISLETSSKTSTNSKIIEENQDIPNIGKRSSYSAPNALYKEMEPIESKHKDIENFKNSAQLSNDNIKPTRKSVPSSFTRTIINSQQEQWPYNNDYVPFYSESATKNTNRCSCCKNTTKSRYSCDCYESIKRSIEEDDELNKDSNAIKVCKCKEHNQLVIKGNKCLCDPMSRHSPTDNHFKKDPKCCSYREEDHRTKTCKCDALNCQCYKEVFLSRPKINRTPPVQ